MAGERLFLDERNLKQLGLTEPNIRTMRELTKFLNIQNTVTNVVGPLEDLTTTGLLARTGLNEWATRTLTGPLAGITVTNGDGVAGNPTLALANDLAALEGLASTGLIARTADGAAAARTLTAGANISITNGNGVSGNPTIAATGLAAAVGAALVAGTNITITDNGNGTYTIAASGGGGGSLVLLEQHTASSSTDLQFTTALTSTYDTYVIEFVGVVPATNGVFLYMQASTNGGTSYDSSGLYSWAVNYTNSAGSVSNPSGGETDTKLEIFGTISSAATGGVSGTAYFYHPASTTLHKQIHTVGVAYVNDSRFYRFNSAGAYRNATAVNALRFYFSSGNIASGTIRIYGVVK